MALEKIDVLALGRGNLTDNTNAIISFSSNNIVALWSSGTTYAQYNVVEYSGRVYRSKVVSNTANQPDISPNQWETLYIGVKDGDIAYVVNGANSSVLQRQAGLWRDLAGQPATVALIDGQASPAVAITFLGSDHSWAQVRYTIRRGSSFGRERRGTYNVLNDNISVVEYDHEYNEIGLDVGVTASWQMVSGNVQLVYTSISEGNPIELRFTIQGWN
jgi:hypothetical protein